MKNFRFELIGAVLSVLPFLPAVTFRYLYEWDDGNFILANPRVNVFCWDNVLWNLTHNLQDLYTPVFQLSLMLDYAVFGNNPAVPHTVSLLIFGLNAGLFVRILRKFRLPGLLALTAAVLWAWNPSRVENAAWIAERKGLLCVMFSFLACLSFLSGKQVSTAVFTVLGILSKPLALLLPGVIGLIAWVRCGTFRRAVIRTLPAALAGIAAGILCCLLTFQEMKSTKPALDFVTCSGNFLRYIGASVVPFHLSPIHSLREGFQFTSETAVGILTVLFLAWRGLANRVPVKILIAFPLALTGTILPVLQSGRFTNAYFTDRYGYLISAVVWAAFAVFCRKDFLRRKKTVLLLSCVFGAGLFFASSSYLPVFRDSISLFSMAASQDNPMPKAVEGLALSALNQGRPEVAAEAGKIFLENAERQPDGWRTYYREMGELLVRFSPDRVRELSDCLLKMPDGEKKSRDFFLDHGYRLAFADALEKGNTGLAVRLLEKQEKSGHFEPYDYYFRKGLAAFAEKRFRDAETAWTTAENIRPGDEHLKKNLQILRRGISDREKIYPNNSGKSR